MTERKADGTGTQPALDVHGNQLYVFDPRLLAFEFITGFMLRQTQVPLKLGLGL